MKRVITIYTTRTIETDEDFDLYLQALEEELRIPNMHQLLKKQGKLKVSDVDDSGKVLAHTIYEITPVVS